MLRVGAVAPDFSAQTTDGKTLRLSDLRGQRVVLFFFPKAFTSGCTIETRLFRDHYPELKALGAEVVGISVDNAARQCAFAQSEGVSFPMIGDEDKTIGKDYDALWPILGVNQRITYVVDPTGRIEAVFRHELNMGRHLEDVRQHLQKQKA